MFSRFFKIRSKNLPKIISTKKCGEFTLSLKYLVSRDGELHWLRDGELQRSDKVESEFIRYGQSEKLSGKEWIGFHPPKKGKVTPELWADQIDSEYLDLISSWGEILSNDSDKLQNLLDEYNIQVYCLNTLIGNLKLSGVKIISGGENEMIFGPAEEFPSFDLSLVIGKDKTVSSVSFDG